MGLKKLKEFLEISTSSQIIHTSTPDYDDPLHLIVYFKTLSKYSIKYKEVAQEIIRKFRELFRIKKDEIDNFFFQINVLVSIKTLDDTVKHSYTIFTLPFCFLCSEEDDQISTIIIDETKNQMIFSIIKRMFSNFICSTFSIINIFLSYFS
ncbi:hypothetical protein CDIK_0972 [Cucumispora dikerogammari]|nr:hypothetical protein CDIK_0972 [Cucumispora dikerogammari]